MENNRHVEVAWTQEELNQKIESLRAQGYQESDIHVVAKDADRFQLHATEAHVDTHESGTFWDRFKSFFTGEDATTESLNHLNLEHEEKERYATDLTNGGAILFVEGTRSNDYNTFGETGNSYESYHGEETSGTVGTEFVNQRFNETEAPLGEHTPEENRELFASTNPTFHNEETHVENNAFNIEPRMTDEQKEHTFEASHEETTPQASFERAEPRFETESTTFETTEPRFESETTSFETTDPRFESETTTFETTEERFENPTGYSEQQAYGAESPGADPNLGPAAFGNLEPAMEDEGQEPSAIEDSLSNHEHEERVEEIENRRSENHMQNRDTY